MSVLTKISDSLVYLANKIKSLEGSGSSSNIHYQLDIEIDTGDYWIDGRKIYRIVKWDKTASSVNTLKNLTKPNDADFIVNCRGFTDETNSLDISKVNRYLPYVMGVTNSNNIEIQIGSTFVERHSATWANSINILLIIDYTKK